jgi:hypothetical protein
VHQYPFNARAAGFLPNVDKYFPKRSRPKGNLHIYFLIAILCFFIVFLFIENSLGFESITDCWLSRIFGVFGALSLLLTVGLFTVNRNL